MYFSGSCTGLWSRERRISSLDLEDWPKAKDAKRPWMAPAVRSFKPKRRLSKSPAAGAHAFWGPKDPPESFSRKPELMTLPGTLACQLHNPHYWHTRKPCCVSILRSVHGHKAPCPCPNRRNPCKKTRPCGFGMQG